jgi:LuxR family transcriptional regulator, maltose regulon positive regulatory protein
LFKPDDIARLCAAALDADIETEYVQSLIRKRGLLPDPGIVTSVRWPWPVRLNVLGGFALEVDGRPVTFGRKVQRRPMELLKALIAAGGRDVQLEKIADWLWPDTEGDIAQNALATTIHRLRHLLGHSEALELRDRRLTLHPRYCWVDCWSLERQIREAQERLSTVHADAAPKDLASLTYRLLQAYPGPFLAQDSASWAVQARRRLADKYRKCLHTLCTAWENRGDETLARACHEKMREVELE